MTRQITSNIGLTYEEDKSKTFSYDNDIKNNMVTIDSEIGSAKNRLSDIENNTEYPQFTPLLTQDSAVFSTGSGRNELGVEVDLSNDIVKGQVSVGVKGNTVNQSVKNGNFANGITNWTIRGNHSGSSVTNEQLNIIATGTGDSGGTGDAYQLLTNVSSNDKLFFIAKAKNNGGDTCNINFLYAGTRKAITVSSSWQSTSAIITAPSSSSYYLHIYASNITTGANLLVDDVMVINLTALGLDNLTLEDCNERFYHYINGTKSTLPVRIKSVGKNLFDVSQNEPVGLVDYLARNERVYILADDASDGLRITIPRVKRNTNYTISGTINNIASTNRIRVEDENRNFLSQFTGADITFSSGDNDFIFLNFTNSVSATNFEAEYLNIQLEEGTISTVYEEYEESDSYVNLPDSEELRSLPNGVKDEVNDGKFYKRTNKYVLQSGDIINLYTGDPDVDLARVLRSTLENPKDASAEVGLVIAEGWGVGVNSLLLAENDLFSVSSRTGGNYFDFIVPKGYYTDLSQAQSDLAGTTLIYQLAAEQITNIPTTPLIAYSKGTITVEPFMYKKFTYNNGITWTKPVDKIEEIKQASTGKNITDYILSNDGLSVTINNALNGEEYTVKAPIKNEESTIPTTVMSYPTNINAASKSNVHAINQLSKIVSELLVNK